MARLLKSFCLDRTGATAVEYGLLLALISIGLVTGLEAFSGALSNMFGTIRNNVDTTGVQ